MTALHVGLLGTGTVGSGVMKVLQRNQDEISARSGRPIVITRIGARSIEKARALAQQFAPQASLTDRLADITDAPDISVVIEVMGGTTTARRAVLAAIAAGKHVITANKALLAEHGNEIFAAAKAKGVMVAFEGAVAVSIPIIKALREALAGNRIEWIAGIINGTTNFILSQMRDQGLDFATALAQAQHLGYAEADPTFDVEGIDAAHKATLLCAIAFGVAIQFQHAHIEGIQSLQRADFVYAEELGYRIKLLGITRRVTGTANDGIELRVHPTLVPADCLLANVNGAMNGIMVKSDAAGVTAYYGAGAGSEQTASAVVADLVDVARLELADPQHHVPHLAFHTHRRTHDPILPISAIQTHYYIRLTVSDEVGVLAQIATIFAAQRISIQTMLQRPRADAQSDAAPVDIILLTHRASEADIDASLQQLAQSSSVQGPIVKLRIELLDQSN